MSSSCAQVEVVSFPEAKSAKFSFKEPNLASAGGATTIVPIVTRKRDGKLWPQASSRVCWGGGQLNPCALP